MTLFWLHLQMLSSTQKTWDPEQAVLYLVPHVHYLVTTMDCEGTSALIFQRFQQICDIQLLAGNSGTILITS